MDSSSHPFGQHEPYQEVSDVANDISNKDAKKFAKTKHKGLPEKKKMQEKISFSGWKKKASDAMKKTAKKKHDYGRDAGAEAAKIMRQKDQAKVNFLPVDEGLKQARKNVGASTCWDGYKAKGTKKKGGKEVPNCVKEGKKKGLWDNIHAKRKRGERPARKGEKDYPCSTFYIKSLWIVLLTFPCRSLSSLSLSMDVIP
jgi:hypothetical protein